MFEIVLKKLKINPSLEKVANNYYTDKNTVHSYLPVYQKLFGYKNVKNILEIGIQRGGSIKLWGDYFQNANVFGIDLTDELICLDIKNKKNISLFFGDAYTKNIADKLGSTQFDVIIDDGSHTLSSMKAAINLYLPKLKEDGIFIIEDLRDVKWFEELKNILPAEDKKYVKEFDLRKNKNRWDDILFVVDRSQN